MNDDVTKHATVIEDRNGAPFSMWFFMRAGRIIRVYWYEASPMAVQEKVFP